MGKVVYRKEKKSRSPYPLLILGAVVVFGFSLVNLVFPKRDQLELENRKAAQLPAFSVSALLDGSWQSGFARWMQDQFALRDVWVNTQRAADEIVFQKVEEGGILLGKDHWMFTKLFTVDDATQKQLAKNVQAVSDFAAAHPGKVTFLLAPSASVIDLFIRTAKNRFVTCFLQSASCISLSHCQHQRSLHLSIVKAPHNNYAVRLCFFLDPIHIRKVSAGRTIAGQIEQKARCSQCAGVLHLSFCLLGVAAGRFQLVQFRHHFFDGIL